MPVVLFSEGIMVTDYQNKMVGRYTTLTKTYDLPSGRVWRKGSVVDLGRYPELKAAVDADKPRKLKVKDLRAIEKAEEMFDE